MTPAIIVPYRNRAEHLSQFVPHMKSYLDCEIHVIEQADDKPFNRGALLNIGIWLAKGYDYYITHDVDMLPIEVDYSYPMNPTHLATRVGQFGWKLPYKNYVGGVFAVTESQFWRIGGYPNDFWGWGGEDDALLNGIKKSGLELNRRECKFKSLAHEKAEKAADRRKYKAGRKKNDGYDWTWFKCVGIETKEDYVLKRVEL